MAMNAPTPVMTGLTWQEFLDLPEEYRHASLIDGELYVTAPALLHQFVVSRLLVALVGWTEAAEGRGLVTPEPAVQIRHDRGYMPDLAWWRHDKCSAPDQPLAVEGPPDLVVEVLSPSTRRIDTVLKRRDYPTIGVREMWFVDPEEPYVLQVMHEAERERVTDLSPDDTLTSPQFDGFALAVGRLTDRRPTLGTPRG